MNTCFACDRELQGDHAGHYLCPGCVRATEERLTRMPKLHTALSAFLAPATRRPELVATRPAEAPLPVNEHVLDLRGPGGIVGVLEDWRAAMQADRGWGPPAITGDISNRITAAARGLHLNLDWIAQEWPQAGQFATELRNLEAAILTVVDPPEHTIRIGYCPAVYEDGAICGAVLRAHPGDTSITCSWCHAVYPPESWLILAERGA